jgi:hypothetical protein
MQMVFTSELIQAGHAQTRADGHTQRGHRLWHALSIARTILGPAARGAFLLPFTNWALPIPRPEIVTIL